MREKSWLTTHERRQPMANPPDLNRRWTLAEAKAELATRGIALTARADGYHLNHRNGGTPRTEFITDNLIDALIAGVEMTKHPPAPSPKHRRRRLPTRKAKIRSHNARLARRKWKAIQKRD